MEQADAPFLQSQMNHGEQRFKFFLPYAVHVPTWHLQNLYTREACRSKQHYPILLWLLCFIYILTYDCRCFIAICRVSAIIVKYLGMREGMHICEHYFQFNLYSFVPLLLIATYILNYMKFIHILSEITLFLLYFCTS